MNSPANPYADLVATYARLFREGKSYPLGGFAPCAPVAQSADAPIALIFSPHPDDECIIGGLALRLLRECGWNVINVAVTQGSARARQAERFQELRNACRFLGFSLLATAPNGLEKVNPKTRKSEGATWEGMVDGVAGILRMQRPRVIFFPHELDWNSTHIGVHFLVMDALRAVGEPRTVHLVETEYWGQMADPNLMVESGAGDVSDLVTGLSFHVGEVKRNPFHLLLPAWMQDNVRRGSELVGGQGEAAPDYSFATLYRHRVWRDGHIGAVPRLGRKLGAEETPAELFA
ncbi:MAG: PIG-L family deacetylase [Pedosphaera sp.]|nr:PIG-L family deacetylase [Pedosphaera sp.]